LSEGRGQMDYYKDPPVEIKARGIVDHKGQESTVPKNTRGVQKKGCNQWGGRRSRRTGGAPRGKKSG